MYAGCAGSDGSTSAAADPEQHATELTDYVHASTLKSFGSVKDTPRKPCISPPTWRIVRGPAPLRRAASVAGAPAVQALLHAALCAWASLVPGAFVPGRVRGRRGGLGWHPGARCGEARRQLHVPRLTSTMAWRAAAAILRMIKPAIAEYCRVFIEAKTLEARDVQARGDARTAYAIPRAFGGRFTTDHSSHAVLSFLDYCKIRHFCAFVLYVDLSEAFGRAIRELVLGIPHYCACPSTYLAGLGLRAHQVDWIVEFIAVHGPLMQRWGVPEKIVRLLKNLRSKSWLSSGDVDTAVSVRLGGKQGCKHGSAIFNGSYSVGLLLLMGALLKAGATLRIHDPGPDFVSPGGVPADRRPPAAEGGAGSVLPASLDSAVPVIDVAFVDDECLLLCAETPAVLDRNIDVLLGSLCGIFDPLGFVNNWKPGKTECSLIYRGHNAAAHYAARRIGPRGALQVKFPGSSGHVTVVHQCKHLGGIAEVGGNNVHEARAQAVSAAEACEFTATRATRSWTVGASCSPWCSPGCSST
ncbi:unnamed protein product [Prorocentrum cordatum]|uniref:Reverse transcriptase domain-containing protein n=1 Tax=Prorocentrum cordatum TaxID=2364126 RepID=A0ABN9RXJ8_9DINO|nr:unnamed protein product [Polarella glacialis]